MRGIFVYRDQWSPYANFHYGQFMERMAEIKKAKEEVATEEDRNRRTQELLARMGATKDSVVLPVPPAACADIARCAVFPRTHSPTVGPAPPDRHRISKGFDKNWRHSESSDTKKSPPSLLPVKETTNPIERLYSSFSMGSSSSYRFT